ncbi:uncharacterized protein LAESUDRAFT_720378 [Laetiporus sulphureus 93-53]|uniref:Uncharacterized protein n=1 Tax=Laetiporus sulphureus 93-53 TaxID=1314785 RepID=A0A165H376_9APHY|nr:uncharacterized protein LAESUDRAFT_720378 [Laetiporus sulphureus 93-53]KZT11182.1 hypothetical protein LAESUDRAFT_720378 [Laetiporus sulphureus 93-53]
MQAIPSHRIHSIHGSFSPGYTHVRPVSAAQALSFTYLPNVSVASARGRGFALPMSPERSASIHAPSSGSRSRVVAYHYPLSTRRAPPPPPARIPRTTMTSIEDPFNDECVELVSPLPRAAQPSSPSLIASRTRLSPATIPEPSVSETTSNIVALLDPPTSHAPMSVPPGIEQTPAIQLFARGRLVACVLLSRNCGRPLRRRPDTAGTGRAYVRSCLSKMVEVEV